jgi:hypothetical protein
VCMFLLLMHARRAVRVLRAFCCCERCRDQLSVSLAGSSDRVNTAMALSRRHSLMSTVSGTRAQPTLRRRMQPTLLHWRIHSSRNGRQITKNRQIVGIQIKNVKLDSRKNSKTSILLFFSLLLFFSNSAGVRSENVRVTRRLSPLEYLRSLHKYVYIYKARWHVV